MKGRGRKMGGEYIVETLRPYCKILKKFATKREAVDFIKNSEGMELGIFVALKNGNSTDMYSYSSGEYKLQYTTFC